MSPSKPISVGFSDCASYGQYLHAFLASFDGGNITSNPAANDQQIIPICGLLISI
jgi:hypothetical protein